MPEPNETTVLRTLNRGLQILEAIAAGESSATAKTLSRQLGIKIGTCYHLLRTLKAGEYVVRLPDGRYDVGPKAASLSRHLQRRSGPAVELVMVLTRLHHRSQETSYMTGWYHDRLFLQHFLPGPNTVLIPNLDVGCTGFMHARASCKAVLAFLPEETVTAMFDGAEPAALTCRTLTDWDSFMMDLAKVRSRGYATDLEEFTENVCCVAAPFFDRVGAPVGSFTVSVPKPRFQQHGAWLATEVREAASRATSLIRNGQIALTYPDLEPRPARRSSHKIAS
ncbi:IclR family transcriptional regulator [Streptomyces violaceusniger]|uniref:IclR family transcriptional regulator n=1 Tax=Streptomyces violaceusniger TaxID=68280 RepID=UPI000997B105|nr:IclR family transcriptional regulator [Streptomyces hygroscopicus]